MFTWLGYKLGEWADKWEENHALPQTIVFGENWFLFSGVGFLVDAFLFCMLLLWIRVQVAA